MRGYCTTLTSTIGTEMQSITISTHMLSDDVHHPRAHVDADGVATADHYHEYKHRRYSTSVDTEYL